MECFHWWLLLLSCLQFLPYSCLSSLMNGDLVLRLLYTFYNYNLCYRLCFFKWYGELLHESFSTLNYMIQIIWQLLHSSWILHVTCFDLVCVWIRLILLKTENNKKKKKKFTVYYYLALFIGLNTLYMADEQCIIRWFKKNK